jgi:lycopene beta-cyclase
MNGAPTHGKAKYSSGRGADPRLGIVPKRGCRRRSAWSHGLKPAGRVKLEAMAREKNHGLLIAGGGVAGSLAALAMARLRPEVPMMFVSETSDLSADRTHVLLDQGLSDEERALAAPLIEKSWDAHYVSFPSGSRKLKLRCHAITGARIDAAVREALRPDQIRAEDRIVAVRDQSLLLHGGETVAGDGALDARSWAHQTTLELGWRKTLARTYRFTAPHRVDLPVIVDATLDGESADGFFACIPFDERTLRIERVELSTAPELDEAAVGARIQAYVAKRGWSGGEMVVGEESSAAPLALGGDFGAYWRIGGARVAKLGARGGFFHPVTGSTFPDALRAALLLTRQRDFSGEALHDLFEEQAAALWRRREYYRSFNQLLLQADGGGDAVLERLYGLDAGIIGRFFAEDLGIFDRRRVMAAAGG